MTAVVIVATVLFSCKGEKKEKIVVKEEVKVEETTTVNNVDLTTSVMTWKGTKPTGSHDGTVAFKNGGMVVEDNVLKSGEFVIDIVTGNLTIKDVTKSITIPASVSTVDGITTFKSELFNIDRADFNVKYGSKRWIEGLKDKFIDDLVEMSFTVVTK